MVKLIYITKYIRSLNKLNTSLEINYYMRLIWELLIAWQEIMEI